MADSIPSNDPPPSAAAVARATSELNNLLQIMAGTSSSLKLTAKNSKDAAESVELLHTSIARAEKVTADLAAEAGGSNQKSSLASGDCPFCQGKENRLLLPSPSERSWWSTMRKRNSP